MGDGFVFKKGEVVGLGGRGGVAKENIDQVAVVASTTTLARAPAAATPSRGQPIGTTQSWGLGDLFQKVGAGRAGQGAQKKTLTEEQQPQMQSL